MSTGQQPFNTIYDLQELAEESDRKAGCEFEGTEVCVHH